ncbi:endonuclease Q family protein [Paenibacillus marinisediminis]
MELPLQTYYGDFHIHIGATSSGSPVKISGSRNLTFEAIAHEASERKGLDLIGIIDCHAPGVLQDIAQLLDNGEMIELSGGGIRYRRTTIMLGTEIELKEPGFGPAHVLCYMPTFEAMQHFSAWLSRHIRNMNLSTQRAYVTWRELQEETAARGGVFIPAHIFTPHKSLYGSCCDRITDVADTVLIDGVELGLSADTAMASHLSELDSYSFLTNSDAHSLAKIAREYNALQLAEPTFSEWEKALRQDKGRCVAANYGLNPLLGKYHRTTCINGHLMPNADLASCPSCGSARQIAGVADRIDRIADRSEAEVQQQALHRPPYIHQVPLEYIPGIGPRVLNRLLDQYGTEMNVLHCATPSQLTDTVGEVLAERIVSAREGRLIIQSGGGGKYGKVVSRQ